MKSLVTEFVCDRCAATIDPAEVVSVKFHVGYCSGAVSQEDDVRVRDFCLKCVKVAFQRVINKAANFEQTSQMLEAALLLKTPMLRVETQVRS